MPIYEYQCEACGHAFEAIQKFSDDPLTDCPSCTEAALKKLMSAPAFRLKGEGWYETDFKSSNKRNLAGSSNSEGGSDSGSGGSSDGAKSDTGGSSKASDSGGDSKSAKSATASTTSAAPAKSSKAD